MMIASNTEKVLGVIVILLFLTFLLSSCAGISDAEVDTELFYCIGMCVHVIHDVQVDVEVDVEEPEESNEP